MIDCHSSYAAGYVQVQCWNMYGSVPGNTLLLASSEIRYTIALYPACMGTRLLKLCVGQYNTCTCVACMPLYKFSCQKSCGFWVEHGTISHCTAHAYNGIAEDLLIETASVQASSIRSVKYRRQAQSNSTGRREKCGSKFNSPKVGAPGLNSSPKVSTDHLNKSTH